jgi:hypothetical protein
VATVNNPEGTRRVSHAAVERFFKEMENAEVNR